MSALGRSWASVRDLFTAVPAEPHGRRPPVRPLPDPDRVPGLGAELLRNPGRLAAACVATVLGPAAVALAGSPDVRTVSEVQASQASVAATPVPAPIPGDSTSWVPLARQAADTCPGLSSAVLVAIGLVESSLGLQTGPSSAGAEGPMQFLPATWAAYGADGDGDGTVDVMNTFDAVHGAARLLCANGGADPDRLPSALWNYNRSEEYVRQVMAVARFMPVESAGTVHS